MANPDSYYLRTEVSNSDLTELKTIFIPVPSMGIKKKPSSLGHW